MMLTPDDRIFIAELFKLILKPNASLEEVDRALARAAEREEAVIAKFHDRGKP